ncbi:MAG TPA: hypothetical protein VMQ93_18660 [Novosphingobium sp.]|nr:hypothetical protein [Novosphingobium sp.]
MSTAKVSRGHPLVALVAVLAGWAGGRVTNWEIPAATALSAPATSDSGEGGSEGLAFDPRGGPLSYPDAAYGYAPALQDGGEPAAYFRYPTLVQGPMPRAAWGPPAYAATPQPYPLMPRHLRDDFALSDPAPRCYAPEPPAMAAARMQAAGAEPPPPPRAKRWSADAWALLRRDSAGGIASAGALPATYGASQAGAVLRYRLALASPYRPTLYMRTTSSMGRLRETGAAVGFSARPLPKVPIIAAVEARLTEQAGARRFQPAIMAVTELPPFALPMGFQGEGYGQAGYVAGSFATPFADGQVRADRGLLTVGRVETRLGAGLWGGAQKGASRIDAGPSASIALPLGRGTTGRVAVDWRFRLAGDAVPGSGPAVTLSAGF